MAKLVKYQRKDKPEYYNFGIQLESGWIVGVKLLDYKRDYRNLLQAAEEVKLVPYESKKKGAK